MKIAKYWVMIIGMLVLNVAASSETGTLILTVAGLRNYHGAVNIAVFATAKGFPERANAAIDKRVVKLAGADPIIEFNELPFSNYAIAVFHDENDNGRLDKNWLGIPKEGVGFSHNPKSINGPPSFVEAKFSFSSKKQSLTIKLIY